MIIIDYNAVAIGAVMAFNAEHDPDLIRHTILNSIRMYNKKFRDEYGQVVIAREGRSWRKEVFPQYKASRGTKREEDKRDWDLIFGTLNDVADDLAANFPYKVIRVENAEADDIIGALAYESQEFGRHEPIMIVSADKDFIQLQKFDNVKQFSPMTKKFVSASNPRKYLFEHLMRGDSGDGVPNVLSPDNTFVDGIRQSPVTQKKIQAWLDNIENLEDVMDTATYRNYCRNKKVIDLGEIPVSIKEEIINMYDNTKTAPKMKVLNYLIKKRCNMLIESVEEFY